MLNFLAIVGLIVFLAWVLQLVADAEPFITEEEGKAIREWFNKK